MVVTRMDGRLESVEKDLEETRGDVAGVKHLVTQMQDQLRTLQGTIDLLVQRTNPDPRGNVMNQTVRTEAGEDNNLGEQQGGNVGETEGDGGADKEGQKYRRLELPLFSGEDPIGWLFRMERYFGVNGVPEEGKLDATAVGMEGRALNWFQWVETRQPVANWREFKRAVMERFHCYQLGDNYERLAGLKQDGTVSDYRDQFELISAPLHDIPEDALIGIFKNGLSEEIKAEVRLLHPKSLQDLMNLAFQVEGKILALQKVKEEKKSRSSKTMSGSKWTNLKPPVSRYSSFFESSRSNLSSPTSKNNEVKAGEALKNSTNRVSIPITSPGSFGSSNKGGTRFGLTEAEINRRRELGLCFKYEEKFGPNHKCKGSSLE